MTWRTLRSKVVLELTQVLHSIIRVMYYAMFDFTVISPYIIFARAVSIDNATMSRYYRWIKQRTSKCTISRYPAIIIMYKSGHSGQHSTKKAGLHYGNYQYNFHTLPYIREGISIVCPIQIFTSVFKWSLNKIVYHHLMNIIFLWHKLQRFNSSRFKFACT